MAKTVKKVAPKAKDQVASPNVPPAFSGEVLDRLWTVVMDRRSADPAHSHSARLLSRGKTKVAQKFGEEAVECLIEAVAGNNPALISESADVLYHLMVMWVAAGIEPADVWSELVRREGVSGVMEKASRLRSPVLAGTTKIP
jgi:phosphoribosyl-ATP pyrophosphohydrolase